MRSIVTTSLGVTLGFLVAGARGEDLRWHAPSSPPAAAVAANSPSLQFTAAVTLGRPIPVVSLGKPVTVTLGHPEPPKKEPASMDEGITLASWDSLFPTEPGLVVRGQSPDLSGPTLAPPPDSPALGGAADPYNCGVVTSPPSSGNGFFGKCGHFFGGLFGGGASEGRCAFQSDHAFDEFISPVSNPFLAEDPRSLTEVRPIFMWQQTPSKNPQFRGGDIEFAGLQARLALTDRLDFVLNKTGFDWDEAHNPLYPTHVGFTELWLGPKFTFLRSTSTGTIGALGATFQLPVGDSHMYQATGQLAIEPYLSLGQHFGRSSYGSFNAMNTVGYSFSVDNQRSEYIFDSLHLDYDLVNAHKYYPLIELNYFGYTKNGSRQPFSYEGRDLITFGSQHVAGNTDLSLAAGFRYKFSEAIQTGLAGEIPITGRHDLMDFRLTVDLIFRY